MIKIVHFWINSNNKASVVPRTGAGRQRSPQLSKMLLGLCPMGEGGGFHAKADKNRKACQELQIKAFSKSIIIYPLLKLQAGNQFCRVSGKRYTLAQDLAWEKIFPRFSWWQGILLKQERKGLPNLYIQDTSLYTAVLGTNVCFLLPL